MWNLNPFSWFSRPRSEKPGANLKYVKLIYEESSRYATYTPFKGEGRGIQAGDYGYIDRLTGEFVFEGSIYQNPSILEKIPELLQEKYQPVLSTSLDKWIIAARTLKSWEVEVGPSVNVAGVVNTSIDLEVSFKEGRKGAFLAMYRPRSKDLPKDMPWAKLDTLPEIKEKGRGLITSVISCPAYALQVSDAHAETVRLKFVGELPVPGVPLLGAGGTVGAGWQCERVGASYQQGCDRQGDPVYSTLFDFQRPVNKSRALYRSAEPVGADEEWSSVRVDPPWDISDDEVGEEESIYDEVLDSDEEGMSK